jgi:YVTN family beta-propeller protein
VRNVRSLTLIDTTTNDANDIDAGDLPRGMQLSPDGKHAYVTNFGDSTLSVVDTITSSVVTTVDVPGHPDAVVVSPDGQRIMWATIGQVRSQWFRYRRWATCVPTSPAELNAPFGYLRHRAEAFS